AGLGRERISVQRGLRLALGRKRGRDFERRNLSAVGEIEPVVAAPDALLDRRLAAERRAPLAGKRAGAKVGVVDLPVGRLDDLSVSGALQRRLGGVLRRDEMDVRVKLVG